VWAFDLFSLINDILGKQPITRQKGKWLPFEHVFLRVMYSIGAEESLFWFSTIASNFGCMFHTRLLGEVKPKQAIVSLQFYKQVPHLHIMMKLCGFSASVQIVCYWVWMCGAGQLMFANGWVVNPLLLWESDCHQSPYGSQFSFVARKTTRIFLVMFLWSFLNYRQEFSAKLDMTACQRAFNNLGEL